ncbi:MAG: hypothetical protein H0X45_09870 [Planctomycetes bacterium]|nr:hypothetical protein [Planctomycetota bacterium]
MSAAVQRQRQGLRRGFTLFEIAISLLLLATAVIAAALAFPAGIRVQQNARFRLYAAAKAEELIELSATAYNANPGNDYEGLSGWDVPIAHRNLHPDLESRIANPYFGAVPVPLTIARRLDSDDDEIQHLLADGGYLYYSLPMAAMDLGESALAEEPSNETQRLVFGVIGHAQANALYSFPWKAWPYHYPCPSPPLHGVHSTNAHSAGMRLFTANYRAYWDGVKQASHNFSFGCWEEVADPGDAPDYAMQKVMSWHEPADDLWYGYLPYANNPPQTNSTEQNQYAWQRLDPPGFSADGAQRYLQAALWYAQAIGLPDAVWDPAAPTPLSDPPAPYDPDPFSPGRIFSHGAPVPAHKQVQALRFLAHAATCMTRWRTKAELDAGVMVPDVSLASVTARGVRLTHELIVYYHESCLNLTMKYAASMPYDWGAPRPMERAIMMDHPLLEWDLFSPPASGLVHGSTLTGSQWRPIAPQRITNIGRSYTYPAVPIPDNAGAADAFWGDPSHFTLCRPFDPVERTRELVFWAVDWKSFEDCETAPSAPLDSSKWLLAGAIDGWPYLNRQHAIVPRYTHAQIFNFRNPEYVLLFDQDMSTWATGADVSGMQGFGGLDWKDWQRPDVFNGVYGADRDFDHHLDRGPLPASVRLRAIEVGRYLFYDARLPGVLR